MELTHTLEVKPNWFIRSFIRFYDLPRSNPDLNTCNLFWGTLGMVVIPILVVATVWLWAPLMAIFWVIEKIKERSLERRSAEREAWYALSWEERDRIEAERNAPKPKSKRALFLENLAAKAGKVWYKVQTPVTWFFRVLAGAVALALVVGVVYLLVTTLPGLPWGEILSVAWKVVLGAIAVVGLAYALTYLYVKWREKHPPEPKSPSEPKKPSVVKAVFHSIHDHTCANIKIAE